MTRKALKAEDEEKKRMEETFKSNPDLFETTKL